MDNSVVKIKLVEIFGEQRVFDSDLDRFSYSYDGSFIPLLPASKPDFIVKASTVEQISNLMKYANEISIPVIPRGTGTGRTGGAIPINGGIVLCMDEMKQIIELDEGNMIITVEPGVRTQDLYDYCAQRGLFYPPDPASLKCSTIGGNIAENAGGARAVKYGVTSNYVMGLEIVLPNGSVIKTGGKAIKNVTGYNLTQLFVGSEGTLGIITKALLRLIALPKYTKTAQATFSSIDNACNAVGECIKSGVVPAAAEIMDQVSIQAVARFRKFDIDPSVEAAIIFEVDGETEENVIRQADVLKRICEDYGCVTFKTAANQQEANELWSLRRAMGPAIAAIAPNKIGEDISVPRHQLPDVVKRLREISRKNDIKLAIFGHAGDGNLHPSYLTDLSIPGESEKMEKAVEETFQAALDVGGTLSGEHGIGITKKPFITKALGEEHIEALRWVKYAFDPKNILNPGKIF